MKDFMEFKKIIIALVLIVPGAFMITDGVLVFLGSPAMFFSVDSRFEFFVGIALVILGAKKLKHLKEKK